jgi:hypothetical protein
MDLNKNKTHQKNSAKARGNGQADPDGTYLFYLLERLAGKSSDIA